MENSQKVTFVPLASWGLGPHPCWNPPHLGAAGGEAPPSFSGWDAVGHPELLEGTGSSLCISLPWRRCSDGGGRFPTASSHSLLSFPHATLDLQGPKGEQGPPGIPGPQGLPGVKGDKVTRCRGWGPAQGSCAELG